MKRPLFWIIAAVTGFFAWQWFMSRRPAAVNQYIDATNGSRQANAEAATAQLDVWNQIAAPLALFRSTVGQLMPDPTQPSYRADGSVVRPLDRTLSDISEPFSNLFRRP